MAAPITPHPYPAAAVRAALIAEPSITELVPAASIVTDTIPPDEILGPYITIAVIGNHTEDPILVRPLVQVTPWVPTINVLQAADPTSSIYPDELAWNIGSIIGKLLSRKRNDPFRGSGWSANWTEGPIMLRDTERGIDQPLIYAPVRFQMAMRDSRTP